MTPKLVDIVLPSGESATVPEEDLSQALAAGATQPAAAPEADGALGQATASVFGAGSAATFGLSDLALSEGAFLAGGRDLQKEVIRNVDTVRKANPMATMAGEAVGLIINPAMSAAGGAVEAGVAARAGEGLLGRVASMGARGAAEGSLLGAQQQLTEATLGDHELNGEALFASVAKNALLGGAIGSVVGVGAYGASKAFKGASGLLEKRVRASEATLDEVAGVKGAGKSIADDAADAQKTIEELRRTGMTAKQAAKTVDDIKVAAAAGPYREAGKQGAVSGLFDDVAERFAKTGATPEQQQVIRDAYKSAASKLNDIENTAEQHALKMSRKGTTVFREVEDTLHEVAFAEKGAQFKSLVDSSKTSLQRDEVALIVQDAREKFAFWDTMATKGQGEATLNLLKKQMTDFEAWFSKADPAAKGYSRDLYVKTDKLKRVIDRKLMWGRDGGIGTDGKAFNPGLPEIIADGDMGLRALNQRIRTSLENESVWGEAGLAQKDLNSWFSSAKPRRDHFVQQMGSKIDQYAGTRITEVDFEKTLSMLRTLSGGEADAARQSVRSTEALVSGYRDGANSVFKHLDLSPKQSERLRNGLRELEEFEAIFKTAREDAAAKNRLKAAVLEEKEANSLGGVIGLIGGITTQPVTTAQRLATVRNMVSRFEDGVANGIKKFFTGSRDPARAVSRAASRSKADAAAEIAEVRELAGNPAATQAKAASLTGDLPKHAPKTAREVELAAIRALNYLAKHAPTPSVPLSLLAVDAAKARYSDHQISQWETKRRAVLDPSSVVEDLQSGKLNRDAIQAVEATSPKLFAMMQAEAQRQLIEMAASGKLDSMPYAKKASMATLLKVPADRTWKPDFMLLMQAAKASGMGKDEPASASKGGTSKRKIDLDASDYQTEADAIEGR